MEGNARAGRQRLDSHGQGAAGALRIDFEDELTRSRRAECEHLALSRLQNIADRLIAYDFFSHVRWQGQHFSNPRMASTPATPITP